MISPQRKFVFNRSNSLEYASSDDQEQYFYSQQGSGSRQTSAEDNQKQSSDFLAINSQNYSKLLRQKQMKLIISNEKIQSSQKQLQTLRFKYQNNQNDLLFFKAKLKQQFDKNQKIESHLELVNNFLIQTINSMAKKSHNSNEYSASIQKKLNQIQRNHQLDLISQSQNIFSLFKQQFDIFSQSMSLQISSPINTSTSFANNHSIFTFKGQTSVQKIEFMTQDSNKSKSSLSQAQKLLANNLSQRQNMEQVLSNNGVEVEQLIDLQGKFSIKSLSKFKMAQLCLKLSKRIKQLQLNNRSLKLHFNQCNFSQENKAQSINTRAMTKSQQMTKKGGLRRIISMRQQI